MGPIQTAIGQAMGAAAGAVVAGKKLYEKNEGQTAKEVSAQEAEDSKAKASNEEAAKRAIKTAQDKRIDSPKQVYFWGDTEEAIGTSNEVAYVLSQQSLHNSLSSKKRARDAVRRRKQELAKRKLVSR